MIILDKNNVETKEHLLEKYNKIFNEHISS